MIIEEKARALAEPLLTEAGFVLWDVIFEKEGAMSYLRILFDKDGGGDGINDEECALMTAPLNALMDKQEFIQHVDILEVGSPGLTRRLRRPEHFGQSIGKALRVMKRADKGKTGVIYGTLEAYEPETNQISLKTDTELVIIGVKNCLKINLDF
ncbi:MAG: ribosome assembly cofactor RimP [Oscillospiraceae bacterium]|jgi:ribosome maturation factor RimP|nr:ribosome assembly cofactor RimP [Oscillospiraceae bacterium]